MSFTRLRYHVVFATKHRTPCLTPEVEQYLQVLFHREAERVDACLFAYGAWDDHNHLGLAVRPRRALSEVLRHLKARSSFALRRTFPHLRTFHWQAGYGALTLRAFDCAEAIEYINHQRTIHEERHEDELVDAFERTA